MTEYISSSDLSTRLTSAGFAFISGDATDAIQAAGAVVDYYISEQIEPSHARAAGNQWLKDRCLDLAVEYYATHGGNNPTQSILDMADRAREWLKDVQKNGRRIPGLTYPESRRSRRSTRIPRIHNVG